MKIIIENLLPICSDWQDKIEENQLIFEIEVKNKEEVELISAFIDRLKYETNHRISLGIAYSDVEYFKDKKINTLKDLKKKGINTKGMV